MTEPTPRVSVVIATYDWSAALRCALRSVRQQTFEDYEVIVVGDRCTDDSAQAVAEMADSRFRWLNLAERHGSQFGPNNAGIAAARGEFIAYLGHDDLWWPTHLAATVRTLDATGADMVAGTTLLYGPAESGMLGVTGLFPRDTFHPAYFFVPSSMVHRRDLVARTGPWRSAEMAGLATDVDFLLRCHAAGARIAAVNELTVFKFNAAWRRNAYGARSTAEQEAVLARIATGDDFRQAELLKALRANIEDRLFRIEQRQAPGLDAGIAQAQIRRFKGAEAGKVGETVSSLAAPRRFHLADQSYSGFEWYGLEPWGEGRQMRWSGPSTVSSILLAVTLDAPARIVVNVLIALEAETLSSVTLKVNGRPWPHAVTPGDGGLARLVAEIAPAAKDATAASTLVTLEVPRTTRPIDLGVNFDRRWLGLAVDWVEIDPTPAPLREISRHQGSTGL